MYADQLPPDQGPEQPKDPFNRPPPKKAADDWITRQYVKGWWLFLPSMIFAFMAPFWLTPTTQTVILCVVVMIATKIYLNKFFTDNWPAISSNSVRVPWGTAVQLAGAHLIAVGVTTGWALLLLYSVYTFVTQEPIPGGESGAIQRNSSGGFVS